MFRRVAIFFLVGVFSRSIAFGLTVDTNPDADAFVRSVDPTHNYGGAGADSVSGSTAVNGSGQQMGLLDTFMRFSLATTIGQFNSTFGVGNWTITGISLQLTEMAAPGNAVFNRGVGNFEIRWLASDVLAEGSGSPGAPTSDGIVYNASPNPPAFGDEPSTLNPSLDMALGIYTNAGTNTRQTFVLPLSVAAFMNDVRSGGEVELFLTAASSSIGFTFNSKDFTTASARPVLQITAVMIPEPATACLVVFGAVTFGILRLRQRHNR